MHSFFTWSTLSAWPQPAFECHSFLIHIRADTPSVTPTQGKSWLNEMCGTSLTFSWVFWIHGGGFARAAYWVYGFVSCPHTGRWAYIECGICMVCSLMTVVWGRGADQVAMGMGFSGSKSASRMNLREHAIHKVTLQICHKSLKETSSCILVLCIFVRIRAQALYSILGKLGPLQKRLNWTNWAAACCGVHIDSFLWKISQRICCSQNENLKNKNTTLLTWTIGLANTWYHGWTH